MWQNLRSIFKNVISDIDDMTDSEIEELFEMIDNNEKI